MGSSQVYPEVDVPRFREAIPKSEFLTENPENPNATISIRDRVSCGIIAVLCRAAKPLKT